MRLSKTMKLALLFCLLLIAIPTTRTSGFGNSNTGSQQVSMMEDQTGNITTVAGNGQPGITGDGGAAINANLSAFRVATDGEGNIFIVDSSDALATRIRRIDKATGIIKIVAGNGQKGFSGDGGLATSASFNQAIGITVDEVGNIFVVDGTNFRVRRIDAATNIISTIAGNGDRSYSGDGKLATQSGLTPTAITIDKKGDLFICDSNNHNSRVLRLDALTGVITTVAGIGKSGFSGDGGPALQANLNQPEAIAIDEGGNLFITDNGNNRIRRVDANTGIIKTIAGIGSPGITGDSGLAVNAEVDSAIGLSLDKAGNLFLVEPPTNTVRRIDATTGIIATVAGNQGSGFSGDGEPAIKASLHYPTDVAADTNGNLFIADLGNNVVRKVSGIGQTKQAEIVIDRAGFNKKQRFLINGKGFSIFGSTVTINGKDVSTMIANQIDSRISLNGNTDSLNLQKGKNRIVVKVNGGTSNTFKLNIN